jgi:hypothetical protein
MRAAAVVLSAGGDLVPAALPPEADPALRSAVEAQLARLAGHARCGFRAVAAGRTAARVWGIPLVDDEDPATQRFEAPYDDVLRRAGRSKQATVSSRRVGLTAADVVLVHGVPVLSPLRTFVDLPVVLRADALVAALDHALRARLVTADELSAAAAGDHRGQDGIVALREALALADPKAESPHESLTRLVLKPVLPGLEPQIKVFDQRGRLVARLDLGDESLRLGVESDGAAYHRGRAAADRRRDARTGWAIERVSWYETRCEQELLRHRVLSTATWLRGRAA